MRKIPRTAAILFAVLMMLFIFTCTDGKYFPSQDHATVIATSVTNALFIGGSALIGWALGWGAVLVLGG